MPVVLKLCGPCGERMLAVRPGASNFDVKVAINGLCGPCRKQALMHAKIAKVPDFSDLRPDREEGFANIKQRRR